jgi:hypothetical protein
MPIERVAVLIVAAGGARVGTERTERTGGIAPLAGKDLYLVITGPRRVNEDPG